MADENTGGDVAMEGQLELFERSHTGSMDMRDFAAWVEKNIGGNSLKEALQNAALLLCCDVIAQDISKATLRFRERTGNNTSKVVDPLKHEIAGLLALEPNRRHTWKSAIEMMVYWSCLTDNAYAVIIRAMDDTILEIVPVMTGRVEEKIIDREVFYDVWAGTIQEQALLGAQMLTVPERNIIHVRTRLLDGMDGYSTMLAGQKTVDILNAINKFRKNLFGDEGQIRGVFTRDNNEPIPDLIFKRLRQQFKELMTRFRDLTEPIVLEGGVNFTPISSKPSEMELTKQLEAAINDMCRLFRMPPHKIFMLDGSKYENLETQEKMYVGDTLVPRAKAFEDEFGKKLMLTRKERLRFFLQFDRSEMTLRDTKVETERAIKALERSAITIDEARAVFGFNPLPNGAGNVRLVPTNMTLVDEHNQVLVTGASTAAPEEPSADPEDNTEEPKKSGGLRLVTG